MGCALWILTGSTAVGKTALSLELARLLDAEILSCDSVQVYRGADIGSAKISPEERANIPHHGLDLCDPRETFDVGRYGEYARSIVDEMQNKNKNLLIVGGAGFYLKSFFANAIDDILVPQNVYEEVRLFYKNFGLAALQRAIGQYGSVDLNVSDWHNPRRLINILAKQRVTGLAQVALKQKFLQRACPFDKFFRKVILLERRSESLNMRIERRVEEMFREGFIEEVRNLGEMCPPLASAIGYREVRAYLASGEKITEKDVKKRVIEGTRQLVKKQKTWFRRQISIDFRINLDEYSLNESFDIIATFCKNSESWV
ncbi:MAG: tRNA (adenosine(37)-N6)-dimethylallyltransferase MiaA [Puniceicoccales bacterium]|jgi:tRNA dimethylallyltransferase|nr:tRNA (adenosine(37)-N6)-dimethylallyltransferase MiaA [Puniceicoccales bacterium]